MRKPQICVTGSALHLPLGDRSRLAETAKEVGREIANQGAVLVIGGRQSTDHLPTCAYEGAMEMGGTAVVIVEGSDRTAFNRPGTIVLPCGMTDSSWEAMIGLSSDALIAIGGRAGSLLEIIAAYKAKAAVIVIQGTGGVADEYSGRKIDSRDLSKIISAETPAQAVKFSMQASVKMLLESK